MADDLRARLTSGEPLTAADFIELKRRVKKEMLRRKYVGTVEASGGENWDYSMDPTEGGVVSTEHYSKLQDPLNAINTVYESNSGTNTTMPIPVSGKRPHALDILEARLTINERADVTSVTTDCASSCTGLCSTGCATTCKTSCTSGCYGTCSRTCADSCSSDGCRGGCGGSCSNSCNEDNCRGSCSQECASGCGGSCSTGCGSECTDFCTGGCTGTCEGGCQTTCTG